MLEQEQGVGQLAGLTAGADVLLKHQGVAVGDGAELADPEFLRVCVADAHLLLQPSGGPGSSTGSCGLRASYLTA